MKFPKFLIHLKMTHVYAVMSFSKETCKFYEISSPLLFFKLDDALNKVEEIVKENNEELKEDGKDDSYPGWLIFEKDFNEIRKEGLSHEHLNYVALSRDQMLALWIDILNII